MDVKKCFRVLLLKLFLLMILGLFVSCSSNSDNDDDTANQVPRFEVSDCPPDIIGRDTVCGDLIVPENRSNPDSGTIKLHIAILKARDPAQPGVPSAESDTGPLVFLTGGPGTSTQPAFYAFDELYENGYTVYRETFGHGRDLIILDQRGTNLSEPALYCSEELADFQTQAYEMSYNDAADLRVTTLSGCYDRLKNAGIDLDGYNTYENAADVKALRDALGYDKINIYGASYGTRLSMTVMKEYPEILRSVAIDSILPPELNPLEKQADGTMFALDAFFKACETDYPDTESDFYDIITFLKDNPVTFSDYGTVDGTSYDVQVTAIKFIAYIVAGLRETPYNAGLPKIIMDMNDGNMTYENVAESWVGIVDFFFTSGGAGSDDPSVGMFESVTASGDAYYTSKERIYSNIEFYMDNESLQDWAKVEFYGWYPSTQGLWVVEPLPADSQYPVVSNIPTLMLVGTLDAGTPSIFSEPSSRYLSNSYFTEILAGHATAYLPCVAEMVDDFIIDPMTEPDYLCETEYEWE